MCVTIASCTMFGSLKNMSFSVPGPGGQPTLSTSWKFPRASERLLWASALKPSVVSPGADWANDA